ncbi:MAG TPA: HAD family hydrolase [Anaerolineaceae bacterium]|nr:HAD family hydrolase [Anaerolineaceae bacterium]
MDRAIFLDRDGVVIENRPEYVRSWADVAFLPHALDALRLACTAPFRLIMVTNQAGIGKGVIPAEVAADINRRLIAEIVAHGARVDALYVCPHAPGESCSCRKPRPGLILQAAAEHDLDLYHSLLIGDALTDLQAGYTAGVRNLALVKTGRGAEQLLLVQQAFHSSYQVFPDLHAAIQAFLSGAGLASHSNS